MEFWSEYLTSHDDLVFSDLRHFFAKIYILVNMKTIRPDGVIAGRIELDEFTRTDSQLCNTIITEKLNIRVTSDFIDFSS